MYIYLCTLYKVLKIGVQTNETQANFLDFILAYETATVNHTENRTTPLCTLTVSGTIYHP